MTQIPSGTPVTLPSGTEVDITQSLGGSYTIHTLGGLFRVAGKDADALGISSASAASEQAPPRPGPDSTLNEAVIWDTLRTCYDPEIPVNIVDLGLIYDLKLEPLPDGQRKISIKMTLTAPGCGMGGAIASDAQQKLLFLDGVQEADVELVWDPPWNPSRISPEGRRILGLD